MLELAVKHADQIREKFLNVVYDPKYQYYFITGYRDFNYTPEQSDWNKVEKVSVHNGVVIGYFKFSVDRDSYRAHSLAVINFTGDVHPVFAKDLARFLRDVFGVYHMRKLTFSCIVGNPILPSYERICSRYGGRVAGVYEEHERLIDGKYHDMVLFEIKASDYFKTKGAK